jgi:hypothetical protein
MTEHQWLQAALLTAAVVFAAFTLVALLISIRGEWRARKPRRELDYADDVPPHIPGGWF